MIKIRTENLREIAPSLMVEQKILLTGTVYTARDAAHKEFAKIIEDGGELPIAIKDAVIYYAGPTPAKPNEVIGSCGPTTSCRMDPYAPALLDMGLAAMIGKGQRNKQVVDAIKRNKAIYLCAIGGAGALYNQCIKDAEVAAFPELGCESVKKLYVEDFPLIVAIDSSGGNIFN